jgi:hypothetical protein
LKAVNVQNNKRSGKGVKDDGIPKQILQPLLFLLAPINPIASIPTAVAPVPSHLKTVLNLLV